MSPFGRLGHAGRDGSADGTRPRSRTHPQARAQAYAAIAASTLLAAYVVATALLGRPPWWSAEHAAAALTRSDTVGDLVGELLATASYPR